MPLPLILAGASILSSGASMITGNSTSKKALAAQKKKDKRDRIANGLSLLNEDMAYATPEYDDNPLTENTRSLYAGGGWGLFGNGDREMRKMNRGANREIRKMNRDIKAAARGAKNNVKDPSDMTGGELGMSIASEAIGVFDNIISANNDNKAIAYDANKPVINSDSSQFARTAQKDLNFATKDWGTPIEEQSMFNNTKYAKGGVIKTNSSDTAMINAGTHESGKDVEFTRPDGTKAKIEGDEGMRNVGGDVQIFSNRIALPNTNQSIASTFFSLSSLKGNLEDAKRGTGNIVKRNTKEREILGVNKSMDDLFQSQESIKKLDDNKSKADKYPLGGTAFGDYENDPLNLRLTKPKSVLESGKDYFTKDGKNIKSDYRFDKDAGSKTKSVSNLTETQEEGSTKRGFVNPDNLNYAATGITLLDNIYNASQMKNLKSKDPRMMSKVELDKEYDTTAMEHGVKSQLDSFYKNVDKNTSSSVVGLNMKLAATAQSINQLNQIFDQKEKYESQMKNQEVMANMNVDQFNTQTYNQYKDRDQDLIGAKSANFANMIDDVSKGLERGVDIIRDRERFAALEGQTAETGVFLKNLEQGLHVDTDVNKVQDWLNKALVNGGINKERYAKEVKAWNTNPKTKGTLTMPK